MDPSSCQICEKKGHIWRQDCSFLLQKMWLHRAIQGNEGMSMSELHASSSRESKPMNIALVLRVALYILLTIAIQAFCWFFILKLPIKDPQRIIFYYISYNIGFLIFNPFHGLLITGFFAWITGIISMFLFITAIGETIIWLRRKREKHE